jgi:hypothetical protein
MTEMPGVVQGRKGCGTLVAGRRVVVAMSLDKLSEHVLYLTLTVSGLSDPPPPDAIDLFNRFLAEARTRRGPNSLAQEIPELGPDARREELFLWTHQLSVAVRRSSPS